MTTNSELPLYQIVDWDGTFENFRSRVIKDARFVCKPNKHGGVGLMNVLVEEDGGCIYGIWCLLLDLCSRQRPPRQGYLTADGKKEGRRYRVAELAYIFRRREHEIRRALQVLSSLEVAWMTVVGTAEGSIIDTSKPQTIVDDDTSKPQTIVDDDARASAERKNERMKERNILSQGDQGDDTSKPQTIVDDDTSKPQTDLIQHAEAKKLFGELSKQVFGKELRDNQWSAKMEHELSDFLPMQRETWALFDWFYRLPVNHRAFSMTLRRQSIESVIENLSREEQKIRGVRQKLGLNGLHPNDKTDDPDLTAEQVEIIRRLYGDAPVPRKWSQLADSVRAEIQEAMKT
jgi:hypothetical protein